MVHILLYSHLFDVPSRFLMIFMDAISPMELIWAKISSSQMNTKKLATFIMHISQRKTNIPTHLRLYIGTNFL
jgi:hypothetical protein